MRKLYVHHCVFRLHCIMYIEGKWVKKRKQEKLNGMKREKKNKKKNVTKYFLITLTTAIKLLNDYRYCLVSLVLG